MLLLAHSGFSRFRDVLNLETHPQVVKKRTTNRIPRMPNLPHSVTVCVCSKESKYLMKISCHPPPQRKAKHGHCFNVTSLG